MSIELSHYPISLDIPKIRAFGAESGVQIEITTCKKFFAFFNLKGDSEPYAAMTKCRSVCNCPYLQDGRLYVCRTPASVHYFNNEFGTSVPGDSGISIHDDDMTGRRILTLLDTPILACRYRTAGDYAIFDWTISRKEMSEWQA